MKRTPAPHEARASLAGFLIAAAVFLIGIGYIAVLPPFEGFDETAHYSSMRQIAYAHTLPVRGRSFIDRFVENYAKDDPMSWPTGSTSFDWSGSLTYPAFFANAAAVAHYQNFRQNPAPAAFDPSASVNWEAQHPPLYYVLMSPVVLLTEHFSFVTQLFILRLTSYLLAFAGFTAGWIATQTHSGKIIPRGVATGYWLYPFVAPMFFSEFGRIGNDSLCVFLLGLTCLFSGRVFYENEGAAPNALAGGVCLGLGLLTKALFLPVFASLAAFMMLRAWLARRDSLVLQRRCAALAFVVLPALVIGGGWYLHSFIATGSLVGGDEFVELANDGGLFSSFHHVSWLVILRDMYSLAASWSWTGSWSLVRVSPILQIPLLMLAGWLFVNYARVAARYPLGSPIWLPVWLSVVFVAAFVYHLFIARAVGQNGGSGWYIQVLAPVLALAMGYGIERSRGSNKERIVLWILLSYSPFFLLSVLWSQMALFAGCATKVSEKYQFDGSLFCIDHAGRVVSHLSVLGWPAIAFACFAAGFLCLITGAISFLRSRPTVVLG